MGILTIAGSIDLAQFWPTGASDTDTTKIRISVERGGIRYQADATAPAKKVTIYDRATRTASKSSAPFIKNGELIVRLQGLDAPEIHAKPRADVKRFGVSLAGKGVVKDYRQHQAETSTVRLTQFLRKAGKDTLPCLFESQLDHEEGPAAVLDFYGRFVGNLEVRDTALNLWILERGLAVPAVYNSMTRDETLAVLAAAKKGKQRGIVPRFTRTIPAFEPEILFREPPAEIEDEGAQRFTLPKLFRRQATWFAYRKIGAFADGFGDFLKLYDERDRIFDMRDFMTEGRASLRSQPLSSIVKDGKRMTWPAERVVFQEEASSMYVDGKRVTSW